MPQKTFDYCLKVWVTGVAAGPLLFYLIDKKWVDGMTSFPEFIVVAEIIGLLFSVPGFIAFCATTTFIRKRSGDPPLQRLKLAGWTLLITIFYIMAVAFWIGDNWETADWDLVIRIFASYFTAVAAAIFFYHLPATPPSSSSPD